MTAETAPETGTKLPGVGDLVRHGEKGSEHIVSDIKGQKAGDPQWEMRPRSGGTGTVVVRQDTISEWEIIAACGTWSRGW